jgi:phosphate transport system protein
MIRTHYQSELNMLREQAFAIGEEVAAALVASVQQLARRDTARARALIADDRLINERCVQLEMAVLTTIATEGPMAGDVRLLAALLDCAGELERVGDYAKGIARVHVDLPDTVYPARVLVLLDEMAAQASDMLRTALTALLALDPTLAREVMRRDDGVDERFNAVFGYALELHASTDDAGHGPVLSARRANYLVWVAHNLERAADRATNICQRVLFTISGDAQDLDAP